MSAINRAWEDVEKLADLNATPASYGSDREFKAAKLAKYHAYQRLQASGIHASFMGPALAGGMTWTDTIPISSGSTFDDAGMRSVGHPAQCEREAMRDLILSPTTPVWAANWARVMPEESNRFVFRFSDGTQLVRPQGKKTTLGDVDQMIDAVASKIEGLCGAVHQEQLAAVYRALSSDGGTLLVNAFLANGISTDARCPLVQTIARDEATGTISIMHSNPPGFPFNFTWTTTVAVDGTVAISPFYFAPAQTASPAS